ncbi:PIG-L deacetylase family protein [Nocardia sp. NPDC059180]|uniref:PIG-L deacetylase family protein n=1 Tax=Nocardia sp. NPDC059180 TaxID=3346761 RepID=UPI0036D0A911
MIALGAGDVREIAVLGAHCDDIAIGAGGTLLSLVKSAVTLRVHALVLSGDGTERAVEEAAALREFCQGAELDLEVLDVPDGHAPAHWDRIKQRLGAFRRRADPDLVFAPQREDAHQDHRLLAELVPTEFRDHLILGYEILKWESDLPRPSLFHPLTADIAEGKARLLARHYPSQHHHDWYDERAFLGLAKVRGVQCHAEYAEAFVVDKAVFTVGGR